MKYLELHKAAEILGEKEEDIEHLAWMLHGRPMVPGLRVADRLSTKLISAGRVDEETKKLLLWLSTPETIRWYKIDLMHADVMVVRYFIDAVKCGAFTDYDGFGFYGTMKSQTNVHAVPILIRRGVVHAGFTHVVWYGM